MKKFNIDTIIVSVALRLSAWAICAYMIYRILGIWVAVIVGTWGIYCVATHPRKTNKIDRYIAKRLLSKIK